MWWLVRKVQALLRRLRPAHIALALLGLAAVAAGLVVLLTRPQPDPLASPAFNALRQRGVLRVGLRTDVPGFSQQGRAGGLEADLARSLASEFFSAPELEVVPVDYTNRISKLNRGAVDCVLALCPVGFSTSFYYSTPYYTDAVDFIQRADDERDLFALPATVGALARPGTLAHQGALTVLKAFVSAHSAAWDVRTFAGAEDMFAALQEGAVDAVVLENGLFTLYHTEQLRVAPQALGTIDYAVACKTPEMAAVASALVERFLSDGTLPQWWRNEQLPDYRAK